MILRSISNTLLTVLKHILSPKRRPLLERLVYVIFCTITIATQYNHEPWFDESHAWLLARENSLNELLFSILRYEGHTGLWYLLLYLLNSLQLPLFSMQLLSSLSACLGVLYLLSFEGVPLIIRILLPFTFFIGYQYNIVARSYVLIPILIFILAKYSNNHEKLDKKFYLPLILLIHISIHGSLIAMSLLGCRLIHTITSKADNRSLASKIFTKWNLIFAINLIFVFFQLYPPINGTSPAEWNFNLWSIFTHAWKPLVSSLTEEPISAFLVLALSCYWFWRRNILLPFIISISALLIFFECKKFSAWHEGLLFLVWVGSWLSFFKLEYYDPKPSNSALSQRICQIIPIMLVIITQSGWWLISTKNDLIAPYSGSKELAFYLKSKNIELGDQLYADESFAIEAVLPYFDSCIYENWNQDRCFWMWSNPNTFEPRKEFSKLNDIEYIVASLKFSSLSYLLDKYPHYKLEKQFNGQMFWKNRVFEDETYILLSKKL